MLENPWGSGADVFYRGEFSRSEATKLREHCNLWWSPVLCPETPPQAMPLHPSYQLGRHALQSLSAFMVAQHNDRSIHPSLRLVAFFGKSGKERCAASAQSISGVVLDTSKPTYLVVVDVEGLPMLLARAEELLNRLPKEVQEIFAGVNAASSDSLSTAEHCARLAALFIFFHEFGHVLLGHLDWVPPITGDWRKLCRNARLDRRALETHADTFATFALGNILQGYSRRLGAVKVGHPELSWFACGLLASLTMFSVLTEGSPLLGAGYHSPFMRLNGVAQFLIGATLTKPERENGRTLYTRMLAALVNQHGCAEHIEGLPDLRGLIDYVQEDVEMRTITLPRIRELLREGRLRGWIVDPQLSEHLSGQIQD